MLETNDKTYPGGKGMLHKWICPMMPSHAVYAEPFVGKGACFRNKHPALRSLLIDSNPRVIGWWRSQPQQAAWTARTGCGIRFVERAAKWMDSETLIYCDPPYVLDTRTKRKIYENEMTDEQHERLLKACLACQCHVMISGYWSEMYADLLKDWRHESRWAMTRGGVQREEFVWMNFLERSQPTLAVEYSSLGDDYKQRQIVDRKVKRWKSRYESLPDIERRAILRALVDSEAFIAGNNCEQEESNDINDINGRPLQVAAGEVSKR